MTSGTTGSKWTEVARLGPSVRLTLIPPPQTQGAATAARRSLTRSHGRWRCGGGHSARASVQCSAWHGMVTDLVRAERRRRAAAGRLPPPRRSGGGDAWRLGLAARAHSQWDSHSHSEGHWSECVARLRRVCSGGEGEWGSGNGSVCVWPLQRPIIGMGPVRSASVLMTFCAPFDSHTSKHDARTANHSELDSQHRRHQHQLCE